MIATFAVEISLLLCVVWRDKLDELGRLVVLTLLFLATFQLAEYFVCGGLGVSASGWSRLGYAAITTLPPLGLHILYVLAGRTRRRLVMFAYTLMIGFVAYFLWLPDAFRGYQCTGNYVIFQLGERASLLYGYYYHGLLLVAIALAVRWLSGMTDAAPQMRIRRNAIRGLITGYMVFLIPTAIVNSINPETRKGIPSIMCGFAVLFALILVFYILPKARQIKAKA